MNYDQLFGNTGDGVYVVDLDGIVQFWNAAAEKILGYSAHEVVGMPCHNILNGKDASCNRICRECCALQMQASEGEPVNHFEMSCKTSGGKPVWLDVSIIHVLTSSGSPKAIVHLIRDVTASHDLQFFLREKLGQAGTESGHDQPSPPAGLTAREREVLSLLKQGANTAMTADKLFISRATVRNHIQNIFSKLGVHTRLEAVAYINGRRQ
jgi:PAS domain S-box-containing protein